jgi:hypothetical protein
LRADPLEDPGGNPSVGLEGRVEYPLETTQDLVVGNSDSQISLCLQDPSILSEIDDSIINFIPSYRDILNRAPLSIYDGGEPVPKNLAKIGKGETGRCEPAQTLRGEAFLLKGAVRGGLEKDFSPLKTRSARKLVQEKENCVTPSVLMSEGPRALRAQKSLERVRK